jgi:hypothetical protein
MANMVIPAETVINNARRAAQGTTESLRYPEEVGSHSMIFNFKSYDAAQNGRGSGNITGAIGSSVENPQGSICLPLPKTLQENTSLDLQSEKLGITGSATRDLYNLTKGALNSEVDFKDLGKQVADSVSSAITGASADSITKFSLFASRAGLNFLTPAIEGGLSAETGTALNPHQALVFSGVGVRQYQFDWTLIPNNETEANNIRNIIKTFKRHSLPTYESVLGGGDSTQFSGTLSRGLFKYPSMVDIFFTGLDAEHFPKFKTAMISQIQVDYTPQGGFVLNKGQTGSKPSVVNLVVSILEADIHTSADYSETTLG